MLAMSAIPARLGPAIAAALALLVPFALIFDGQVHVSQGAWMATALAGGMLALVALPNLGAAMLLAYSSVLLLSGRYLAVHQAIPLETYQAAVQAHGYLVAGVAILALTPLLFRGRPALLLGTCRALVLLTVTWWLAGLLGVDPLLRPSPDGAGLAMGHNGGPFGSPIILAGLVGASWPLFIVGHWAYCLPLLAGCLAMQDSATGWLAAAAAGFVYFWACAKPLGTRLHWWIAALAAVLLAVGILAAVAWHRGPGASHRLMLWAQVVQDSRLIGWGPGSWVSTLGQHTGHDSPYSAYALVLWEYGWTGLACLGLAAAHSLRRAQGNPALLAALVGLLAASGGTMIWEQPITATWGSLLLGLIEVDHDRGR